MDYLSASLYFGIVRRRIQSLVVEASMDMGLTYAEFSVMLVLFDSQDDMTNYLHVDKAAITRVIKKLESRGYLFRKQDEIDRRLKRLFLTEEGKETEKKIKEIVQKILHYLTEDFSDLEKDTVVRCLHSMAQKLVKADFSTIFEIKE